MSSLTLNGVTVNFPFTPYDCQKDYMTKVIECLQKRNNGVLESPTGTGKTLCLLCATLAWREQLKDQISRKMIERRLGGETSQNIPITSWGSVAADGEATCYTDIPKIIYASRTHSQLAQVIKELKNTSYRPKISVLGSREQLCINQEVMRQESSHVKVHMCRRKVSTRSCPFYNNTEEISTDRELTHSILDVEDLVKFGNKKRVCPYYLSRSLKQEADIIFMPYNYLVDPKSRRAHNIELNGAVVIFDEAHNLEKTCEESTSFDLTPYDVASAIAAVDRLLLEQVQDASLGPTITEQFNADYSGLKIDATTIAKIKKILLDLEAAIDSYDVPSERGITKPGIFIYELLERAHLTYQTKTEVHEALEQISGYLAGQSGIFLQTGGLQKLADILQLVFCGDPSEKDVKSSAAHFKVHIHRDTSHKKKQTTDIWTTSSSNKQGNILSYWCFSPGFSMQDLVNQGVRCIILTSGTLSPLSSFTSEMRIEFPVSLENSHVIDRDQIFVSVVDRGPDGVQLSSAFDKRFVPENMASLGNTVANLTRVVPHGLLVFFSSFPLMEKMLEFWRANGQAERIDSLKPIFVEPKGKANFTEVIDGYYNKVNDPQTKGGSFFAVCRGKASEGLDFADTFGRAVIITGLPFPPKMDPRVILKMQFLDEMSSNKTSKLKFLSGQQWYKQQAFRAVNQAIGRVIRHRHDFGAILLCDHRFKNPDARAQLPLWVKPYVNQYDSFGNVIRDVSKFFRVAQKRYHRPAVEQTAAAESCGAVCPPDARSTGFTSDSFSQGSHIHKATALDTHLPSLKRKRLTEDTGVNGMTTVYTTYECKTSEIQKRPNTLLDALQRGDQCNGVDTPTTVGQRSSLSTLSLQYDKRIQDDLRGGKRKIRLVQEQKKNPDEASVESKTNKAKSFLGEMKKSLSQVNFDQIIVALQSYKTTDSLEALLSTTSVLTEDANTHNLFRGMYQFVRPHHKKLFHEKCQQLTGHGCGFEPNHSLPKNKNNAVMLTKDGHTSVALKSSCGASSSSQLNTQHLNHGGHHLSQKQLRDPHTASVPRSDGHPAFLAEVKRSLPPEKSAELFQAISCYKKTDNYDNLVVNFLGLFKDNVNLLVRLGIFIRPHHKKKYKEMLDGLAGQSAAKDEA
ncbi:regulator of telomere elongation helicase 1 [Takifugu rubripes]|uniref:Regulator of telomere elongation helicase 1 n=1 Tax=Takifugu rubripes TaxID=31033 RepID=H2TJI5_TAKRU|nr:regulator of telomere elongation helicase 1 [Takifugu rubripes]XP_011619113.1 regulator of telomere elongation helicase 1 [Takifugu rubripes]|eukprot:XP_011619108.1 PREDICTED: regulator of telomere elongation helicase 1 [Takifugu rubripes]